MLKATPWNVGKKRVAATPLARPFWIGLGVLVATILATAHPQNVESAIGATMIIAAGCLPSAIWTLKRLGGLPVFPIFAMTYIWAFGLPLLYEHPIVIRFDPESQLFAAMSVTGFLLLATLVWHQMRLRTPKPRQRCLSLESSTAETVFLAVLGVGIVFTIAVNGWWLGALSEVYSIIRAVMLALEALSCFVLSYRLGSRELGLGQAWIFKVLLLGLIAVSLPTLYLVTAISLIGIAILGYVSASGKVPWTSIIVVSLVASFLHAGKSDMRQQYWEEEAEGAIQPWDYPIFFGKWIVSSTDALFGNIPDEEEKGQSIVERSSLMQLLLYEQEVSPNSVPFMWGDTYVIVPQLLIPRILYPNKPEAHEGTHLLNIHYGFQTAETSQHTTIGFGLLNESFANFGFIGMAMLALILGGFYGYVERLALSVPLLSLRGLFVILVACYSFQVEYAAGVWASTLFQSTIALLGLSFFLMKVRTLRAGKSMSSPVRTGAHPLRRELEHA
jgi:hypothetical protein